MIPTAKPLRASAQDKEYFIQLCTLLADLKHPSQVAEVMQDFLTPPEQIMLSKRLQIGWLLHQKHSYEKISATLGVSSATIGSVAKQIESPGWRRALKTLHLDRWAQNVLHMLLHPFPKDAIGV